MLVSCPECGVKISEEADPCLKCGLEYAGKRSKEYCERLVESLLGIGKNEFHNCVDNEYSYVKFKIITAEVRKARIGYYVQYRARCLRCGKEEIGQY